jgi:hypothetical protein
MLSPHFNSKIFQSFGNHLPISIVFQSLHNATYLGECTASAGDEQEGEEGEGAESEVAEGAGSRD